MEPSRIPDKPLPLPPPETALTHHDFIQYLVSLSITDTTLNGHPARVIENFPIVQNMDMESVFVSHCQTILVRDCFDELINKAIAQEVPGQQTPGRLVWKIEQPEGFDLLMKPGTGGTVFLVYALHYLLRNFEDICRRPDAYSLDDEAENFVDEYQCEELAMGIKFAKGSGELFVTKENGRFVVRDYNFPAMAWSLVDNVGLKIPFKEYDRDIVVRHLPDISSLSTAHRVERARKLLPVCTDDELDCILDTLPPGLVWEPDKLAKRRELVGNVPKLVISGDCAGWRERIDATLESICTMKRRVPWEDVLRAFDPVTLRTFACASVYVKRAMLERFRRTPTVIGYILPVIELNPHRVCEDIAMEDMYDYLCERRRVQGEVSGEGVYIPQLTRVEARHGVPEAVQPNSLLVGTRMFCWFDAVAYLEGQVVGLFAGLSSIPPLLPLRNKNVEKLITFAEKLAGYGVRVGVCQCYNFRGYTLDLDSDKEILSAEYMGRVDAYGLENDPGTVPLFQRMIPRRMSWDDESELMSVDASESLFGDSPPLMASYAVPDSNDASGDTSTCSDLSDGRRRSVDSQDSKEDACMDPPDAKIRHVDCQG